MLLIKIKQQDLLHDGKNIFYSVAYFTLGFYQSIYDNLNFPKRMSISTYGLIASACKLRCFEYENKKVEQVINTQTKSAKICLPLLPPISGHVIIQLGGYFSFISEYSRAFSGV